MNLLFEHGGDLEKAAWESGCSPKEIIDFSNLLNPSGWPPGLEDYLKTQVTRALAHPCSGDHLKDKISQKIGIPFDQIFLGAGTTEFIHFLPLLRRPQKPMVIGPTYGDYFPALCRLGLEPEILLALEENHWVLSEQQWEESLSQKPDWIILSRPNNPLGQKIERPLLKGLIQIHPEIFFVVDETCIELSEDPSDHLIFNPCPSNLAVLRSFSKTYAVPGLRLGYLVVSPEMGMKMKKFQMPWSVSSLAQAAGVYLLDQQEWLAQSQKKNQLEKERVFIELKKLRTFKPVPSLTPSFTIRGLADGFSSTEFLKRLLMEEKILIRSLSRHPGLGDTYFRVGLGSASKNNQLLSVLQKSER